VTAVAAAGGAAMPDVPAAGTSVLPNPATVPPPSMPSSIFGPWGLDLTARDPGVRPGSDFYSFANGHWLAANTIPPDRTSWNADVMLAVDAEQKVQDIIQSLPVHAAAGSLEQKIGDYYRSFLDVEQIEHEGMAAAAEILKAIDAAASHEDIATLMGRPDLGLESPVNFGISIDEKNPDRYVVGIGQGGLGLPQREYYLSKDAKYAEIRGQYVAHIARMLKLAGASNAEADATTILNLETRIAEDQWPIEKQRERDLTYNLESREQLLALAPGFPWRSLLGAAGVSGESDYIVGELDAVQKLARKFTDTPVAQWKTYLRYHFLVSKASVLPKALDDERFSFYGRILNGQPENRARWKRSVQATNRALGEAIGQLYVAKYFPPNAKAQMLELVENLRAAYKERIQAAAWMTPETRQQALKKLATFRPKIGYPDKWRDYSSLIVKPGDAFGNLVRTEVFNWQRDLKRLHQPTDRDEWYLTPQTVNAYYNPVFNEIVFPAAILQPPYFDPKADPAVNYGGIGATIGHEMSHGFDDQGAKSDEHGILRSWWRPEDEAAFKALGDRVAAQYDQYSPIPGLKLNGRLTLGENLGDLNGVAVAYAAYHASLKGQPAPVLDSLTGDQRFFLSYAQGWRGLDRPEVVRTYVMSDPHSPSKFRVNGVLRNIDAWYEAFGITPADPLYLAPAERVHMW
jgi:predicted metalloendopeptidase